MPDTTPKLFIHGTDAADILPAGRCSDDTVLLLWYGAVNCPSTATPHDGVWCYDHEVPARMNGVTRWAIVDPTAANTTQAADESGTGRPTIDALVRYLDAYPNQRVGQAVYNIAREVSGRLTPETSDVFNMADPRFIEAANRILSGDGRGPIALKRGSSALGQSEANAPAEPPLPDLPQIGMSDSALADIAVNIATVLGVSPTECLRSVGQLMRDQIELHERVAFAAGGERSADREVERLRTELASLKEKLLIEAREYMTAKRVALDAIARLAKARGALYVTAEDSTELSDDIRTKMNRIFYETKAPEWWPGWAGDWAIQEDES